MGVSMKGIMSYFLPHGKVGRTTKINGVKKKAAILANCQGQAISDLLKKNNGFMRAFDLVPLDPIHLLKESDSEVILEMISTIDLLIHQQIGYNYGVFSSSNVISLMKTNSLSISFPVAYFSGYNPETVYMKDSSGKTIQKMGYNDLNIMRMFLDGLSTHDMVDCIEAEDYYPEEFLLNNFNESILSLIEREKNLDVKISRFISDHARERRLFFSMNHPTNEVLLGIVRQILSLLSISFEKTYLANQRLGRTKLYMYPSVRKALDLSLNDSIVVDQTTYTLEEYVARFITLYKKDVNLVRHNVEMYQNGADLIKKKLVLTTFS